MSALTSVNTNFFTEGPRDAIFTIMRFLTPAEKGVMRCVSKRLAEIGNIESLYTPDQIRQKKIYARLMILEDAQETTFILKALVRRQAKLTRQPSLYTTTMSVWEQWFSPVSYEQKQFSLSSINEQIAHLTEELSDYKTKNKISEMVHLGKEIFHLRLSFTTIENTVENAFRNIVVLFGGQNKWNQIPTTILPSRAKINYWWWEITPSRGGLINPLTIMKAPIMIIKKRGIEKQVILVRYKYLDNSVAYFGFSSKLYYDKWTVLGRMPDTLKYIYRGLENYPLLEPLAGYIADGGDDKSTIE